MSEIVKVNVNLEISDGVEVSANDLLELSLNCFVCERTQRVVILKAGEETGICTPTKHRFPAKILAKETVRRAKSAELNYRVEYWFAPVVDSEYKESAENILKWGRVYFQITCPECGKAKTLSIQNNTVRPWTCYCVCGYALYSETAEYPRFEKIVF